VYVCGPGHRLPTRAPVVQRRRSTRSAAHIKINVCATPRQSDSPQGLRNLLRDAALRRNETAP
jgi:hypothetical protein